MSTPTDCHKVTWNFSLQRETTDEDIAQFSLWFDDDGAEYGDEQLAHIAQGAYMAWGANVSSSHWTNAVILQSTIASTFLANGHTLHEVNYVPPEVWVGTGSPPSMPWETSLATSLYSYPRGTFVSNGRRKRGRFYVPPMASALLDSSNSGYFDNRYIAAYLGEQKAFLEAANQDEDGVPHGTLSVFSRMDSTLYHVVQISLDAKFDSQRRRENREKAGYLVTPFS